MPAYSYVAYDRNGRKVKGVVESGSETAAINDLATKGLVVVEIRETGEIERGISVTSKKPSGTFAISISELAVFSRQFATMISAGVRVKEALDILASQEVFSKRFKKKLEYVSSAIESGRSLSEAFEEAGGFESIFVNLIRAGEEGGTLDRVLEKLADFYESSKELSDEVKASMRYPMFIGGFAILVVFAIMFYILPMLVESIGLKPTGFLASLMGAKDFLSAYKFQIFFGILATVVLVRFYLSTVKGRIFKEKLTSLFPPLRKINMFSAIERFSRTMAILISAGVSVTNALEMAAQATGNKSFELKSKRVTELIREGRSIRDAMAEVKLVPRLVYEMVGTGEATGKLDEVMERVADFYEQQLRISVKKFVSLLEPMMIVFVGGVIAFIALSMYSAIFTYQTSVGMGP
jgi:type IV pilus assembly protein PilC